MQSGTCWPRSESFIFMPSNVYLQKQHFMFHIPKKIQLMCNAIPVQLKVYNICNMNNELILCPDNKVSKSECSGMAFSG